MASNDFHDGIDVCVGNWGYYSEGELRDTWMHLPMDPDEIEPWLRGHGLVDEEHEETYISDYDGLPFRCPQVFNEYARLDKLNVLAMQLTLLPEGDLAHIQAAIDHGEPLSRPRLGQLPLEHHGDAGGEGGRHGHRHRAERDAVEPVLDAARARRLLLGQAEARVRGPSVRLRELHGPEHEPRHHDPVDRFQTPTPSFPSHPSRRLSRRLRRPGALYAH